MYFDDNSSIDCNSNLTNNINGINTYQLDQSKDNIYTCNHCEKTFRHQSNLESHLMIVHAGEFFCNVCDEQFLDSNLLINHLFTHRNDNNDDSGISEMTEIESDIETPTSCHVENVVKSNSSKFATSTCQIQEPKRSVSITEEYVYEDFSEVPKGDMGHCNGWQIQVCDGTSEKTQNIVERASEKTQNIGDQASGKTQNDMVIVKYGSQKIPHRCDVCQKQFLLTRSLERHKKEAHQHSREPTRDGLKVSVPTYPKCNVPYPKKDQEIQNKSNGLQGKLDLQIPDPANKTCTSQYANGSVTSSVPEEVKENVSEINIDADMCVKYSSDQSNKDKEIKSGKFLESITCSLATSVNKKNESEGKQTNSIKKCHSKHELKRKFVYEKGRNKHPLPWKHLECFVKLYDLFDMCDLDNYLNNSGVKTLNVDRMPKSQFLKFIKNYKKRN